MNISIIAVGSELLLGQIANTNGQFLSQCFNRVGQSVVEHRVIGDNPSRLAHVIRQSVEQYDAVILTGGLGPTKDDLTKHTVAEVLGRKLVMHEPSLSRIKAYFDEIDHDMTPNNEQQALVIEGSTVLDNHHGMAPGMYLELEGTKIALLPGPPKEMRPMAEKQLLPYFIDGEKIIYSEQLKFAGIGESKVETVLMDLIDAQSNPTIAPLAGTHEVYIRLTASGDSEAVCKENIAPIKTEILRRMGHYYFGSDDVQLEQAVMQHIDQSFAIYDGVTDGVLLSRLKRFDQSQLLEGYMHHHPQFIEAHHPIETRLKLATALVKSLYHVDTGVAFLHDSGYVYLAIEQGAEWEMTQFAMPQDKQALKNRSCNYLLIRLLEWFKWHQFSTEMDKKGT